MKPHKRTYAEIELAITIIFEVIAIILIVWHIQIEMHHTDLLQSISNSMKQSEFNFETSRQLTIPRSQGVSENQDLLEQAKSEAKNPKLSEAERRDAAAAVEVLKQTPLVPVQ